MKRISSGQFFISVCAASAILAGCGGSAQQSYQPSVASQNARAYAASCQGQQLYDRVGRSHGFSVPMCTASVYVDAKGASGESGGNGGEVSATIQVVPGETLIVTVGGAGNVAHGGFNGGGAGAANKHGKSIGGGGGGASDVRQNGTTLADRIVVAGGGGGSAIGHPFEHHCPHCQLLFATATMSGGTGGGGAGGSGGVPVCDAGNPIGGGGGSQSSGGAGGAGSNGGSLGQGGAGINECIFFDPYNFEDGITYYASGGGGGYYGGGGGCEGGSGGGGSGYSEPSATYVSSRNGVNSGNGSVLICWGFGSGCGSK